ncbi:hypothetical protein GTW66_26870 [Streptomyces sp. SID5473]|nr:hypothetical protein [Streptomyces sp. SID5473]
MGQGQAAQQGADDGSGGCGGAVGAEEDDRAEDADAVDRPGLRFVGGVVCWVAS